MTENDMDYFIVSTPKSKALRRAFMGNTLADLDRRVDRMMNNILILANKTGFYYFEFGNHLFHVGEQK